jgi:hypothetical protein
MTAAPGFLSASVVLGSQATLNVAFTNLGTATAQNVQMLVPGLAWVSIMTPPSGRIDAVPGGATVSVSLQLSPSNGTVLGSYSGSVLLQSGTDTLLATGLTFDVLSDQMSTVQVLVQDELTYYAPGAPLVANASILLQDSRGLTVATGMTAANGSALIQVRSGSYMLVCNGPAHQTSETGVDLQPGVNSVTVFVARASVSYKWTVTPTTITDEYKVQVKADFTAYVDAPVITVEPSVFNAQEIIASGTEMLVINITNWGLVAATGISLQLPSSDEITLTPLTIVDGLDLPARSSLLVAVQVDIHLPTDGPSASPTAEPTAAPSREPTGAPSLAPTNGPSAAPSRSPSARPTLGPTPVPSNDPSSVPTFAPTATPSEWPTPLPGDTGAPSTVPSRAPSASPTAAPSQGSDTTGPPSSAPTTAAPSLAPSPRPTFRPTRVPTSPTSLVTATPTRSPTRAPQFYVYCAYARFSWVLVCGVPRTYGVTLSLISRDCGGYGWGAGWGGGGLAFGFIAPVAYTSGYSCSPCWPVLTAMYQCSTSYRRLGPWGCYSLPLATSIYRLAPRGGGYATIGVAGLAVGWNFMRCGMRSYIGEQQRSTPRALSWR